MPNTPGAGVPANSQNVAKALGRMFVGAGIAVAGISIGSGLALGLYYVGRGIERHGIRLSECHEAPKLELSSPPSSVNGKAVA